MTADLLVPILAGIAAGAVASVSGFGIGSILLPALVGLVDTRSAIVLISVPHLIGTALRFVTLRQHVDRRVLLHFGVLSAAGALAGALLHGRASSPVLEVLFAGLLIFVGLLGLTGRSGRLRFHGPTAWMAGAVSGLLGGLVGNQGGIRSAGLLGFPLDRRAFVGTATAVALIVDAVRMPVYFWLNPDVVPTHFGLAVWLSITVVAGTLAGRKVLDRVPQPVYVRVISGLLLALAASLLVR
jgi:hypothetical protein